MALSVEAAELVEIFQWLTPEQSKQIMDDESRGRAVEDELADILQYVVRLADVLDVDLGEVLWRRLRENADRYPADLAPTDLIDRMQSREWDIEAT